MNEVEQRNERFDNNFEIIYEAYKSKFPSYSKEYFGLLDTFMPENCKILTQIDLDTDVMAGAFSKVFPIKNSELLLKLFVKGVEVEKDIERMKRITDNVFGGKAAIGQMHFFEFGTLGEKNPDNKSRYDQFKYVIMPRITPFEKSITYKEDPQLFNVLSEALQEATFVNENISYTDFFEKVMNKITNSLQEMLFLIDKNQAKDFVDKFSERLDNLQDTISKIIRISYKTFKEEGGKDLHLGNLGFFPQKPDDWFFFDM